MRTGSRSPNGFQLPPCAPRLTLGTGRRPPAAARTSRPIATARYAITLLLQLACLWSYILLYFSFSAFARMNCTSIYTPSLFLSTLACVTVSLLWNKLSFLCRAYKGLFLLRTYLHAPYTVTLKSKKIYRFANTMSHHNHIAFIILFIYSFHYSINLQLS